MSGRKSIVLVVGGARSGKSRYAQELAARFKRITYIATARPTDAEMKQRILEHRRQRPANWNTAEVPSGLSVAIAEHGKSSDVLLIECFTTYVGSLVSRRHKRERIGQEINAVCDAIKATRASVVAVSNEVGSGVVPAFASGRLFQDLLGELNQQMATIADRVVFMVAGIPLDIKSRRSRRGSYGRN